MNHSTTMAVTAIATRSETTWTVLPFSYQTIANNYILQTVYNQNKFSSTETWALMQLYKNLESVIDIFVKLLKDESYEISDSDNELIKNVDTFAKLCNSTYILFVNQYKTLEFLKNYRRTMINKTMKINDIKFLNAEGVTDDLLLTSSSMANDPKFNLDVIQFIDNHDLRIA